MSSRANPYLFVVSLAARAGVAVLLLAVAGGIFYVLQSSREDPQPVESAAKAIPVRAIRTTEVAVPRLIEGFGTVRAMDAVVVSAQVGARVIERPAAVEAGSAIARGDLIVRLESVDFENRVESERQRIAAVRAQLAALKAEQVQLENQVALAEQEIEIDRRDLTRIEKAVEGGSGTQADVDVRLMAVRRSERSVESLKQALVQFAPRAQQLEAELGNLRATLAIDEQNLERTEIRSPIDGFLQTVDLEVGELPAIGTRVARVVNLDRVEVPLRVPVSVASLLSVGDEATLRGDGPGSPRWIGEVARIAPESDPATRTLTVFIEVEQVEGRAQLKPGRFVMGGVRVSSEHPRVVVPRRAVVGDRVLVARPGDDGVMRVAPVDVRVAHFVELDAPSVDPGERQWAVLEQGLSAGEFVITSNLDELVGGVPVEPAIVGEGE